MSERIRVLIVDDSTVIRGLLTRVIEADPAIQVAATAANGSHALSVLRDTPVDVILLDIEMPVMDGITALPLLREAAPESRIIMTSTLTLRGAEITLRALENGADDFVPKPSTGRASSRVEDMSRELIGKIKSLATGAKTRPAGATIAPTPPPAVRPTPSEPSGSAAPLVPRPRPAPSPPTAPGRASRGGPIISPPEVLAIGSSTGGPNALEVVLQALPESYRIPILITQHMPPMFTTILARRLNGIRGRRATEAEDGMSVEEGCAYVAPGDHHMIVEKSDRQLTLHLTSDPQENFCRPSVDVTYRSLARACGARSLAVVLTGMGEDGRRGAECIVQAGGRVLAQDHESSVVWGMPGAVAQAGIASAVVPLQEMAASIEHHSGRTRVRA